MTRQSIQFGIVGFLVGGVMGLVIAQLGRPSGGQTHLHAQPAAGTKPAMTMDDMTGMLHNKTGDQFDHAFLDQMMAHHQGAIDMANLAKHHAHHQEIKQLADNILATQSKEIDNMHSWQRSWGYHAH